MRFALRGAALVVAALITPATAQPEPQQPDPPKPTTPTPTTSPTATPAKSEPEPPTPPAPAQPPPTTPAFQWKFSGFLRLQYVAAQNDPNVLFVGRDDGFELQNARVAVEGRLAERARFVVSIDGAIDERERVNIPQGKLKVGLRDAYLDVALADRLPLADTSRPIVRGGFFQTWLEPESQVGDTGREFVDRPLESRGVRATQGFETSGLTPGRSLGVAVRFEPGAEIRDHGPLPGVEFAIQNGADEFSSNNDNDKPAVSLAGLVRFAQGYIVAGARYNPRSVGELPGRMDEDDLQATGGAGVRAGIVAIGVGAAAIRTTFPSTGGPAQNAYGAHAQLTFGFGGAAHPVRVGYRFAILDPSSLLLTDRVIEHTVGGWVGVPSLRMRVQLQATHVVEQAARDLSNSRIQAAVEVSL